MGQNRYDAIICDLGNVLVNFDHRIAVRKILQHTPKAEEDIYALFFDSPLSGLYEEGKLSTNEFFKRVKDFLRLNISQAEFLDIWNDIFFEMPLNVRVHDFLRSVKNQYKLVMLSNLNESHFEFLKKKLMNVFNEFDALVLSYEEGFRKPAPEIYKKATESVDAAPEKVFYIDDRKDLIEAAGRLGIKGVVFDGEAALEKISREIGWIY